MVNDVSIITKDYSLLLNTISLSYYTTTFFMYSPVVGHLCNLQFLTVSNETGRKMYIQVFL